MSGSALDRAVRKIYWRFMPTTFLLFVVFWSDRNCLSLAKLKMVKDLPGFQTNNTETIFGLSQTLCSMGLLTLQIPSIIIVEKWGVRRWFFLLSIIYGITSGLTAFVTQVWHLYLQRFVLGVAGSGFFTGIVTYFGYWLPSKNRGLPLSIIFIALQSAFSISPKISYVFIRMGTTEDGIYYQTLLDLKGWQWMYLAWSIPSILLSIPLYFLFLNRPSEANWLTKDEHDALELQLAAERQTTSKGRSTLWQTVCHIEVLLLCVARLFITIVGDGFDFFTPTILDEWYHLNDYTLTWFLAVSGCISIVLMLCIGWSSDYFNERYLHIAILLLITSLAIVIILIEKKSLIVTIVFLTIATSSLKSSYSPLWSLCSSLVTQEIIASQSIGAISMFGDIGESVGPFLVGLLRDRTSSFTFSIISLLVSAILAGVILGILFLHLNYRRKGYEQNDASSELTHLHTQNE